MSVDLLDLWKKWDDRKIYNHYCYLTQRPIEKWQIDDWQWIDTQTNCCILRSRKASKTTDLMDWLVIRLLKHPKERWAWFASKQGQLTEATLCISKNPFYLKRTYVEKKEYIMLKNGAQFVFGGVTTASLGLFLDGVIFDEQQDLTKPKQSEEIYPQILPALSASSLHKIIHAGTRWLNTRFDDECDQLPTRIRDWTQAPWLVKSGFVDEQIKTQPKWFIDLQFRCIRTTPRGLVWAANIRLETADEVRKHRATNAGIDINAKEIVVEGSMEYGHIWVTKEWEGDYIGCPEDFDPLKEIDTEVEDGGYNSKLARIMQGRIGCSKSLWDSDKKSARQELVRQCTIHICPQLTPMTYNDVSKCEYDPKTGLYYKDPVKNPCHYVDSFLHMTHSPAKIYPVANRTRMPVGMDEVRLRAKLMARQ